LFFLKALIQYIRGENIDLFEKPHPPQAAVSPLDSHNALTTEKNFIQRNFETDVEWHEYCKWLQGLCDEAVKDFLKGIKYGVLLNESWIVCQGAAYLWNYLHHLFVQNKYSQVTQILTEILEALKKVGHDK
jgi:hypothetical protein